MRQIWELYLDQEKLHLPFLNVYHPHFVIACAPNCPFPRGKLGVNYYKNLNYAPWKVLVVSISPWQFALQVDYWNILRTPKSKILYLSSYYVVILSMTI
jgi:hypothetical protein